MTTPREGRQEPIKSCSISNPFLAAHVTGLIRATVGEMIASIPAAKSVVSVTTDGFVTNADLHEIEATGPVCSHLSAARQALTGDSAILEPKFDMAGLLPWRTRGIVTLAGEKPKVARGGMKTPRGIDPNVWLIRLMIDRTPGTKWTSRDPIPFRRSYETNADHVFVTTERKVSFEFDYKRRLVNPVRRYVSVTDGPDHRLVQHISCDTVPWGTIDEFNATREQLSNGDTRRTGCCERCRIGIAGNPTSAARRHRRAVYGGVAAQAKRAFIRAYVRREWGLPGGLYRAAADALTAAGYQAKEQDFKNALRHKEPPPEHTIPADADGVAGFVAAVKALWPNSDSARLLQPAG